MRNQKGNTAVALMGVLLLVVFALTAAVGWVLNIVTIAHANFSNIDGMLVIRIIGVFAAPLGAILGYC